MFRRHDVTLMSNPVCMKPVENLEAGDFQFYDKDGFELNIAEQKYYDAMGFPIHFPILNHCCWQEPWFTLKEGDHNLVLDHSMFLCRAMYQGPALEQIKQLKKSSPAADYLARTRIKWGFDFALDAVNGDNIFEVVHIEYDNYDYDTFTTRMLHFEYTVRHTDWEDAADRVWNQREKWCGLQGFEQNHWKAKFLLGWDKAEYTEKTV